MPDEWQPIAFVRERAVAWINRYGNIEQLSIVERGRKMPDEDAIDLFARKVRSAEQEDEHWTKVTLECGHITSVVCYTPVTWMPCAQCVHEFMDRERERKSA